MDDTNLNVNENLTRIKTWLGANAPALLPLLNPPATEQAIASAEERLGGVFPPSVRQAYLLHEGEAQASSGIFGLWRWLPLEDAIKQTEELQKIEAQFAFGDWVWGQMLPLMESAGGDLYYVEAAPDAQETPVIEWWHEQPSRDIKYPDFATMLHDFATDLEQGRYSIAKNLNGLIEEDDKTANEA